MELEGYIQSHTALDLYELQGQVPETILSGQTADISPFVEYRWYDFVRWYDIKAQFPQLKERYHFGLEIPKTVKRALEIDTKNGNDCGRKPFPRKWRQ